MRFFLIILSTFLLKNVHAQRDINADSVYEYLNCVLIDRYIMPVHGYEYAIGITNPIIDVHVYQLDNGDTLVINTDYFLHRMATNEVPFNSKNILANLYTNKGLFILGNKYYIKFKVATISYLYDNGDGACSYHLNRQKQFKWRIDKNDPELFPCIEDSFFYANVGDVEGFVIVHDIHDSDYPRSLFNWDW